MRTYEEQVGGESIKDGESFISADKLHFYAITHQSGRSITECVTGFREKDYFPLWRLNHLKKECVDPSKATLMNLAYLGHMSIEEMEGAASERKEAPPTT